MGKPDKPLLSLEAHGSIGDALTYQGNSRLQTVRKKPQAVDVLTLPRAYQRWDYQHYAYLWTQLSLADKESWRATASRQGITPFNAFMRDRLLNLPDLIARWRLDESAGATAADSSKNTNTGTMTGTSPQTGIISNARLFDGVDDWMDCGNDPSLDVTTQFTITLWFNRVTVPTGITSLFRRDSIIAYSLDAQINTTNLRGRFRDTTPATNYTPWLAVPSDLWAFLVLRYAPPAWELSNWQVNSAIAYPGALTVIPGANNFHIGRDDPIPGRYIHAYIDDLTIFNTALSDSDLDALMARRYP